MYRVQYTGQPVHCEIELPLSKSLSNRLLIINYLQNGAVSNNLSDAADTVLMQYLLNTLKQNEDINVPVSIHTGNAGTVTRFLLPLLAITKGTWIVTGDRRMLERPIQPLVKALQQLGADITYLQKENFLPLSIKGGNWDVKTHAISMHAGISSQFVSGLMMIAPLIGGLHVDLQGNIVSKSYISMTAALMRQAGADVIFEENYIKVNNKPYAQTLPSYNIESDWSAASFFYQIAAFTKDAEIVLHNLHLHSAQGDACLPVLFENLGVKTTFFDRGICLTSSQNKVQNFIYDFTDCPDLVQPVAVTCALLNINAELKGIETLFHKETNRIEALKNELGKLRVNITYNNHSLFIKHTPNMVFENDVVIKTYADHRMAMAFAPVAAIKGSVLLDNLNVVDKSFPKFWQEMNKAHFTI